ncbi:MFS transporter [Nocardiopsis oceani]
MTDIPHRWWALAALTLAVLVFDLNLTIVNVALPTLAVELDATTAQLQWLPNAYMLMVAAALLPAGLLGDRFGPRKPLLVALLALAAAAVGCSLATTPEALNIGQGVLGLAAGFVPALTLSLVNALFPGKERARALAVWTAGLTLGIPLGPIVGGALLAHFWWGTIFLVNLPLVAIAVVMIALLVPGAGGSDDVRFDAPGVLMASGGLVAFTYGLVAAGERGWAAPLTLVALGSGVLLLAGFALWVRRAPHPIVRPELFRSRGFVGGVLLATLVTFALMGAIYTLPQYFQAVFGSGPLGTGLRLMPVVGGLLVGVLLASPVRERYGARTVIAAGFAVLAAGAGLGAVAGSGAEAAAGGSYGLMALWMAVVGAGAGLGLPATMDAAMAALRPGSAGVGSAVMQALRQVGGAFGVALIGGVLAAGYRTGVDVAGLPSDRAEAVLRTPAGGVRAAEETGSAELLASVRGAFVQGMAGTLCLTAGVAVAGAVTALVLLPKVRDEKPSPVAR